MADPCPSAANGGNGSAPDPQDGASLCPPLEPGMINWKLQLNQHTFQNRLRAEYNIRVLCCCPSFVGQEETTHASGHACRMRPHDCAKE